MLWLSGEGPEGSVGGVMALAETGVEGVGVGLSLRDEIPDAAGVWPVLVQ